MRDIKFRVKYGGAWCYINLNEGLTELGYKAYMECVLKKEKFYQYTGLKDKNGKEIYEGDIVSRFGDTQRAIVEFNDGCFMSIIQLSASDEPHMEILCNDLYVTEVIGNIHENPELLNK